MLRGKTSLMLPWRLCASNWKSALRERSNLTWVTELLEVSKVLHHEPLLLGGYRPAAGLRHQEQDPLAVLRLARMVCPRHLATGAVIGLQPASAIKYKTRLRYSASPAWCFSL